MSPVLNSSQENLKKTTFISPKAMGKISIFSMNNSIHEFKKKLCIKKDIVETYSIQIPTKNTISNVLFECG